MSWMTPLDGYAVRMQRAAIVMSVLSAVAAATADTVHHVPSDFATIQQAINAASVGDGILVAAGRYAEAIDDVAKSLTIASVAGAAETIIDASAFATSAVTLRGEQSTLQGFTITGGSGTAILLFAQTEVVVGGGVFVAAGHAHVVDCVITRNSTQLGGGMYVQWSSIASLYNCHLEHNTAQLGAGLFSNAGRPYVHHSRFEGNQATTAAGAFIIGDGTFVDCEFVRNSAVNLAGGVFAGGGHTEIFNCVFSGNNANEAGGLLVTEHGTAELVDCAFRNNTAIEAGGAASVGNISDLTVSTTHFCGNEPDVIDGVWIDQGGNTFLDYCNESDLNGDGVVDVSDLLILFSAWGPCPRSGSCLGDLNHDGVVDVSDLLILLSNWGWAFSILSHPVCLHDSPCHSRRRSLARSHLQPLH